MFDRLMIIMWDDEKSVAPGRVGTLSKQWCWWRRWCGQSRNQKFISGVFPTPFPFIPFLFFPSLFLVSNPAKGCGERCYSFPSGRERNLQSPDIIPAANTFLVYLESRERVWWLQMSPYFCQIKSKNWNSCGRFWMYCISPYGRILNST